MVEMSTSEIWRGPGAGDGPGLLYSHGGEHIRRPKDPSHVRDLDITQCILNAS